MIVISGVLLLVAVVLLVIGLITTPLAWVYASIAVSVVSFVFLLLGVRQRREAPVGAERPDVTPAGGGRLAALAADDSDVTVVPVTPEQPAGRPVRAAAVPSLVEEAEPEAVETAGAETVSEEAAEPAEEPTAVTALPETAVGGVLVVPGRPRYHVAGCRYLSGRDTEPRSLEQARAEGFTACGVCRPDEAVGAGPAEEPTQEPATASAADAPPTGASLTEAAPAEAAPEPEVGVTAAEAPVAPARRRRASAATAEAPADAAPTRASRGTKAAAANSAPGRTAPGKAAPSTTPPSKTAPSKTAAKATANSTASSAASKGAAAPRRQEKVVVIPDRDKYHLATCRFVRDLPAGETEELTKATARRQGFEPCGVCKP